MAGKVWTLEEDIILKKYYPVEGIKCAERLPGRTRHSCMMRAMQLELTKKKKDS
jgi:hypothetical protein